MYVYEPIPLQKYAEYVEINIPKYPIPKGKSTELETLLSDPLIWGEDLITRIDRGTEKVVEKIRVEEVKKSIKDELKLIDKLPEREVKQIYRADEYLKFSTELLNKVLQSPITTSEFKQKMKKFPYREFFSNRALIVVVYGSVLAGKVLSYAIEARKQNDLSKMMIYESFVEEYLSYMEPFDTSILPEKPIATMEEIKELRWD